MNRVTFNITNKDQLMQIPENKRSVGINQELLENSGYSHIIYSSKTWQRVVNTSSSDICLKFFPEMLEHYQTPKFYEIINALWDKNIKMSARPSMGLNNSFYLSNEFIVNNNNVLIELFKRNYFLDLTYLSLTDTKNLPFGDAICLILLKKGWHKVGIFADGAHASFLEDTYIYIASDRHMLSTDLLMNMMAVKNAKEENLLLSFMDIEYITNNNIYVKFKEQTICGLLKSQSPLYLTLDFAFEYLGQDATFSLWSASKKEIAIRADDYIVYKEKPIIKPKYVFYKYNLELIEVSKIDGEFYISKDGKKYKISNCVDMTYIKNKDILAYLKR